MAKKPTFLKEIDERYTKRIARKALFDDTVDLSIEKPKSNVELMKAGKAGGDGYVRLLDEGYILDSDGNPYRYIKKGVVSEMYNAIKKGFVGHINLGHMDYSQFPYPIGTWTKNDLRIVDIGKGREALDVKVSLDEESIYVKEFRRLGNPLGVSIEMAVDYDWSDEGYGETGVPTIEKASMMAFAVVGEAGNANSGGLKLNAKGDIMGLLEKFKAKHAPEGGTDPVETGVDSVEAVELSAEEYEKVKECLATANEYLDEKEEYEKLLVAIDKENDELKAKVAELEEKYAAVKDEKEKVVDTKAKNVEEGLAKLGVLTAKFAERQKKEGTVDLKVKKPYEQVSADGLFGGGV